MIKFTDQQDKFVTYAKKISKKEYKNCLSKSYNYKNKNICVTKLVHKKEV